MRIQLRILVLLIMFSLSMGCSKEDTPAPTYADVDWYAIQDDPSNPLKHLIYDVYKTTGVSIFYLDTLGRQFRGFDGNGDSIIFKKVININYKIDENNVWQAYELSKNEKEIWDGVVFLRDYVIPRLVDNTRPKGFLLVDELTLRAGNPDAYTGTVFRSFDATVVGRLKEISTMTEAQLKNMAAEVLAPGYAYCIYAEKERELEGFYKLANFQTANNGTIEMYAQRVSEKQTDIDQKGIPWEKDPAYFGFLDISREHDYYLSGWNYFYYYCPSQPKDIENYIVKVLNGDDAAFEAEFGESGLCMQKYEIMKEIVAKFLDEKNNGNK